MASYAMKKVNGSECNIDELGLITNLRDGLGRTWVFTYKHKQLMQFIDPHGNVWGMKEGRWTAERVAPGIPTPKIVAINHATGEIRIQDNIRMTAYMPDGTTHIEVVQIIDDEPVRVRFIEYPTRPVKSFVVVERRKGVEQVSWIQDANSKLFKLEYEEGKLIRYIDMSAKPAIVWHAHYDGKGVIAGWTGTHKGSEDLVGAMHPVLQSVELNGNRHFKSQTGAHIVVDPTGAAYAPKANAPGSPTTSFATAMQAAHLNF